MKPLIFTQTIKSLTLMILLSGLVICSPNKSKETEETGDTDKAVAEAEKEIQEVVNKVAKKDQTVEATKRKMKELKRQAEEAKQAGDAEKAKQLAEEIQDKEVEIEKLLWGKKELEKEKQIIAAIQNAAGAVRRAENAKDNLRYLRSRGPSFFQF